MPLEEHDLGPALSDAAELYQVEAGPLLEAGIRRGLRLRRRRRVTAASGMILAVALAGTGLGYGTDLLGRPAVPASPEPAYHGPVSGRQIAGRLAGLLPQGKLTDTVDKGAGGGRPTLIDPEVSAVFDDGHGAAQILFSVTRVHLAPTDPALACTSDTATHRCTRSLRLDGSSLTVTEDFAGPGRTGLAFWTASLVTPSGYDVRFLECNSATALVPPRVVGAAGPSGKSARTPPLSRPEPPLDAAHLAAVVTDQGWSGLLAAMRSAQPDHQLPPAQVAAIARPLLPADARPGKAANQEGSATFDLGSQARQLDVTALRWPGPDARREVVAYQYRDAQRLPDGTLIHVEDNGHRQVLVRALHPDGMSVEVNQETLDPSAGPAGLLTVAQLRAIALSPAWDRPAPAPATTPAAR